MILTEMKKSIRQKKKDRNVKNKYTKAAVNVAEWQIFFSYSQVHNYSYPLPVCYVLWSKASTLAKTFFRSSQICYKWISNTRIISTGTFFRPFNFLFILGNTQFPRNFFSNFFIYMWDCRGRTSHLHISQTLIMMKVKELSDDFRHCYCPQGGQRPLSHLILL